jgi:hypothetical protein
MAKKLFNMPIFRKNTKKEENEICERCKWKLKDHEFGLYCYSHSDQDTDYFYHSEPDIKRFVPKGTEVIGDSFNGKIYATDVRI